MKYFLLGIWVGLLGISVCTIPQMALAQQDGFLGASDVAPPSSEGMLPPEAVVQGPYVQHTIQSSQENLHLLASFYYGNPREWRKIYEDNREVIKNPNRLPVGKVIQIHVGDNWQPKVAYAKWFELAVRNGEWKPGVPWKRANPVPAPSSPPPDDTLSRSPEATTEEMPSPTSTPEVESTLPIEAPPSEHPEATAETPETESTPPPEEADQTDSEQAPPEEEAPAEPAF